MTYLFASMNLRSLVPALSAVTLLGLGCPTEDDTDDDAGADGGQTDENGGAVGSDDDNGDADTVGGVDDTDTDDGDGDDGSDETAGSDDALQMQRLLDRLPGLWAAPVTSETSVGDFPIMNMDVRAADSRTLFSRVDLDGENNLRFAFTVEDHDGLGTVLVFRNGGFFSGILRDTRTYLHEYDEQTDTWRFCAIGGGCTMIDARMQVDDAGAMDLEVDVFGMHHFHWTPTRVQERPLPDEFSATDTPGSVMDPFPPMPTLDATLEWTQPADEGTPVWLILFAEPCAVGAGACDPSRFFRGVAQAGDTALTLSLDQIHPGSYFGLAVVDHNGNLATTLLPDPGDVVSLPNVPVTVDATGTSTEMISVTFQL